MEVDALSPSPLARFLLELEQRRASGLLEVGGRRLVLHDGALTDVVPAEGDLALVEFLKAAGRLTPDQAAALPPTALADGAIQLDRELVSRDFMDAVAVREVRRALWLDRAVRGFAADEQAAAPVRPLEPLHAPRGPYRMSVLPFVLDVLMRRAGFGDAERIGHHAAFLFEWQADAPLLKRAREWAELGEMGEAPQPVGSLLLRHPGAASRIAALIRAGLARLLSAAAQAPAPPRRPSSIAPASQPPATRPPLPSTTPGARQLDPGTAERLPRPLGIKAVQPWIELGQTPLDDPLEDVERRIAAAEQRRAPAAERAALWLEFARLAATHYDCPEEAARGAREAAAADLHEAGAHGAAARRCAAVGQSDLAYAYAHAAANLTKDPTERTHTLREVALYAQRAGRASSALRALQEAVGVSHDPRALEQYARALHVQGDTAATVEVARQAAGAFSQTDPVRALHLLSWANSLSPEDPDLASEYAAQLAQQGLGEAAAVALLRAARLLEAPEDAETRAGLRANAAIRAELAGRPDLAAEALLDSFEELPREAASHEPLLANLEQAGCAQEASLVAEEVAGVCEPALRGRLLLRAAQLDASSGPRLRGLLGEALKEEHVFEEALAELRSRAEQLGDPHVASDALEVVLRDKAGPPGPRARAGEALLGCARELDAPALERWAHACLSEIDGRHAAEATLAELGQRERVRTNLLLSLEQEMESTEPALRGPLALRIGQLCRDDPQRRIRAAKLLSQAVEREPTDPLASTALTELLWLNDDLHGLVRLAGEAPGSAAWPRLLAGAYAARARGEFEIACDLCLAVLSREPGHGEALALLSRAERVGLDPERAARVMAARMEGDHDPRQRARAATRCAEAQLAAGDVLGALRAAELALGADPHAARAAELLSEHYVALGDDRAIPLLRSALGVLGEHPALLWQLAQACGRASDTPRQLEALEALVGQSEFLSGPAVELLRAHAGLDDVEALTRAVRTALEPARRTSGTANAVLEGVARLAELGGAEAGLRLAIEAVDALGEGAERVLAWIDAEASRAQLPLLRGAALERQIVRLEGELREARLRELAAHERSLSRPAHELRVWLRLLALSGQDDEALGRLAAIYGSAGDADRMLSVLTLRLEAAEQPALRADAMLEMAAAALAASDDTATAADMVRGALQEAGARDAQRLERGVGLLLDREPQAAFDLLLELASQEEERADAGELYEEAVALAAEDLGQRGLALQTAMMALEQVPERTRILVQFERLALDEGNVEAAVRLYEQLIESALGVHGQRALLYRKARWLERAGESAAALATYVAGFRLSPSAGVVLASIERLAEACGDHEILVECLLQLAPLAPSSDRRAETLLRAADLCAQRLNAPERALSVALDAYQATPGVELVRKAAPYAATVGGADPEHPALSAWREQLRQRSGQAWDVASKVRALVELGVFEAEGSGDRDRARAAAEDALKALQQDPEDIDEGVTRAGLYASIAALCAELPDARTQARSACEAGLALSPEHAQLSALRERLASAADDKSTGAEAATPGGASTPTVEFDAVAERPYADRPARSRKASIAVVRASGAMMLGGSQGLGQSASAGGSTLRPPAIQAPTLSSPPMPQGAHRAALVDEIDPLCDRVAQGQRASLGPLLEQARRDRQHAEVAVERLLGAVQRGTLSPLAISALAELASPASRPEVAVVVAEILALENDAEPSLAATPKISGERAEAALAAARATQLDAAAFRILELAWTHAAPLFRRTLHSYGVTSDDVLRQQDGDPIASAYADAAELTGQQAVLYQAPDGAAQLSVTVTTPPALLVGESLDVDPPALRARFAACLERCRPDAVLMATLAPEIAESLLDALRAAFGPTSGRDSLEREAAAMAAELWRTVPPLVQREITDLFRGLTTPLERAPLARAVEQRAARVGLLAAGHVALAVQSAGRDAPLGTAPPGTAPPGATLHRLADALEHPLARSVVQLALSEEYLRLRAG